MKSRLKFLPWLSLGAGVLGAGLYLLFSAAGTDDRGLLPGSHPLLVLLYILMAVVPALLFFSLRRLTDTPAYGKLFPSNKLSFIGCIAGSVGILINTIYTCTQTLSALTALAVILSGFSVACLLFVGWFRLKLLRPHYIFHSIVAIYLVLELVSAYQTWNTQPQLQIYLPQLTALILLMLTAYHRAALDAGTGRRRDFAFCNLAAIFFCCLAVAGNRWPFFLGMAAWCFTNQCSLEQKHVPAPMVLPEEVLYCIDTLEQAGYSTYVVGGCVRDHLLGLTPSDYDLCTSATPEQICDLFSRHELVRNGEKHGTIGVVLTGQLYEITTFRTEGGYSDTRHPDWVEFVTDIKQDLARRDFTVNAMAFSPAAGFVDPFSGQQDLQAKLLRAVGEPETRFREDALRILRGVRFAVRFGLIPEKETLDAMLHCAPLMEQLAWERVSSELCKLLPLITTQQLLCYREVITQIIPELCPTEEQDLYPKAAALVGAVSQELPVRLAALLQSLGEETANNILLRLKTSNALRNQTLKLIRLSTLYLPPDKKQLLHIAGEEGEEAVKQAIGLQKAIAGAAGQDITDLEMAELLLSTIRKDGSCLSIKDLAITGSDLLSLGTQPGPHIGKCMQALLSLVQDEILANTKEELLEAAKTFLEL